MHGRIDASRQITGGQQYQTTASYFFSPSRISIIFRKIPCCSRPSTTTAAPFGNEFSAGYHFADHHFGNAESFMKTKEKRSSPIGRKSQSIACITARGYTAQNFTGETNVAKC
jgi:hypothetical protein